MSLHVCFIIDLGICVSPTMGVQGVSGCGWYASGGREKMFLSVFIGILLYMKHLWARQVLTPTLPRSGDRKAETGKWGKEESGEKGREEKREPERKSSWRLGMWEIAEPDLEESSEDKSLGWGTGWRWWEKGPRN